MPWETSNRRKDPPGWKALRQVVIAKAQGQCEQSLAPHDLPQSTIRCSYPGTDVDHIINVAQGGTDHPSNLQLLCAWHHKQKTAQEAKANRIKRTEQHPKEKHPGILD